MRQFPVHLGERFLAAHSQYRVTEGNQNPKQAELSRQVMREIGVVEKTQSLVTELQTVPGWQRIRLVALLQHRDGRPTYQQYYHHGRDLHYGERFLAGFLNSFG